MVLTRGPIAEIAQWRNEKHALAITLVNPPISGLARKRQKRAKTAHFGPQRGEKGPFSRSYVYCLNMRNDFKCFIINVALPKYSGLGGRGWGVFLVVLTVSRSKQTRYAKNHDRSMDARNPGCRREKGAAEAGFALWILCAGGSLFSAKTVCRRAGGGSCGNLSVAGDTTGDCVVLHCLLRGLKAFRGPIH